MSGCKEAWDGTTDRRADPRRESDVGKNTPLDVLFYRVDSSEKKIDKIDEKVDVLTIGFTTLKVEMSSIAKDEGKLSGIIYGIGGAVITAIIIKLVENGIGG